LSAEDGYIGVGSGEGGEIRAACCWCYLMRESSRIIFIMIEAKLIIFSMGIHFGIFKSFQLEEKVFYILIIDVFTVVCFLLQIL
jgi:hypothetical protein